MQLESRGVRQGRLVCVVLVACGLLLACSGVPFQEREPPLDRWSLLVVEGKYDAAASLLSRDDAAEWLARTTELSETHGRVASYQRGVVPNDTSDDSLASITLTWRDGFEGCLVIRPSRDGRPLDIVGPAYGPCDRTADPE